jgi:hypothetical protein
MFLESWHYHPMGLPILALFAFTAAQSLLPGSFRERLANRMEAHATLLKVVYLAFATVFIGFGALRALAYLLPLSSRLNLPG